ncbi:MAG: CNP1-like family protein [Burkholderiaceae bacterium]
METPLQIDQHTADCQPCHKHLTRLTTAILGFTAALAIALPAQAQRGDLDIEYGGQSKPAEDPRPSLALPAKLPAVTSFEQMVEFDTDGATTNRFALDPASIRLQPNYALAAVAVLSAGGASTIGLYGFACNHLQYRLMAYPKPDGSWQVSSPRARWRPVRDSESRNRQYRAVYAAACRVGGQSAESAEELMRYLREGRELISP